MVTITDYKSCISQEGKEFFAITLQGEVSVSQSSNGNFYLTANKASLPTSFKTYQKTKKSTHKNLQVPHSLCSPCWT